jgi:UTP--glucose-1-phosphate uridylyltransferase
MTKVTKAVIPAAGLGTRFLPITKSLPKEMLPIIDVPTLELIVREAVAAGIKDILIIVSGGKNTIENHFDYNYELEDRLLKAEKNEEVAKLREIAELANLYFIRQKQPKGLGHAILCAESFVGDQPFAILLGDDLVFSKTPAIAQLSAQYEKTGSSVLGVQEVDPHEVDKYGIIAPLKKDDRLYEIKGIIEKPALQSAPSNLAVLGRYVLTPQIFNALKTIEPGKNGEYQLTDAIFKLLENEKVYAYDFVGDRHDVGDRFGYLKAQITYALNSPTLGQKTRKYIVELAKSLD